AVPAGARLPEPLVTVLVGYETLAGRVCELASGTVVTPGALLRWLDEAWVERVVFDGPDRIKNVGPRRRLFSGATRRAVEVRDRECYSPYCDVPAEECEIDHVVPFAHGGPTVDANGRPACGYHNRTRRAPPALLGGVGQGFRQRRVDEEAVDDVADP
ncbi:MAG TPA: HNH endonuclease signature motif containing protein, partial [Acidimicrobiales bacterium]